MSHSHPHSTVVKPMHPDAVEVPAVAAPTHDVIAHRAYDIYVKTGYKQGQCKQNWQQAEQSIREQRPAATQSQTQGSVARPPIEISSR